MGKKEKSKKEKTKKEKVEKSTEGKKSSSKPQVGGQRKFSGSLALTKLQHVIMNKKGKKGKKVECIVIPVDANYIERGMKDGKPTGALYLNISVITRTEEDDYGQHGFVGQNVSSKAWKDAKDKEKEKMGKLPILGNIKDFAFDKSDYVADTGGSAGSAIDEEDDLPF